MNEPQIPGDRSPVHHPVFAAVYDPVTWIAEATVLRPSREYLVAGLSGRVLDVGMGTGALIPYVATTGSGGPSIEYHGIEPDPAMRRRAERKAARHGVAGRIVSGVAEALPYGESRFDAVVAATVFCSVHDPERALDELARVLRSGGEFRFLEHVHAAGWRGRVQTGLAPVWRRVAGGCQLDRATVTRFRRSSSFTAVELERVSLGIPPVSPFYRGRFRRR